MEDYTMRKVISMVLVLMIVFCMTACGSTPETKELTNVAEYEDCVLTLGDACIETTDEGDTIVKVNATYTNKGSEPLYAYCSFAVRAFQNDVQIDEVSDINGDEASLIKEIKNGETIDVTYVFKMADESKVEVLVGEPTADQTTIGTKEYFGDKQ